MEQNLTNWLKSYHNIDWDYKSESIQDDDKWESYTEFLEN